jgi:hypothetical protein
MTEFVAQTYQNEYLPAGATEMHAIVSVTAASGGEGARDTTTDAEVVMIVDTSGSMNHPRSKLQGAKEAAAAAIDGIRDGVRFAVVGGYERAEVVFPFDVTNPALATATPETRAEARRVVADLRADGGTAMGTWLLCAEELFSEGTGVVRRAILLTDGRNETETADALRAAVAVCEGRFECECRGVGADWVVDELRTIASRLHGTVDIIPQPEAMAAEFRSMMRTAMAKHTADVQLRVWTPTGTCVVFLKQVLPDVAELTGARTAIDERSGDYATGSWGGDETRDYHVCIQLPSGDVGDEMLAGRVCLVVDGVAGRPALVRAVWTDDIALSTRISREVAHYTGQVELAEAVQEGIRALRHGDDETATLRLGRAVELATASGDTRHLRELERLVDVDDAATGTVRLKRHVDPIDEMVLETRSVKTMRVAREPSP